MASPSTASPTATHQRPISNSHYSPHLERYLQASLPAHTAAPGQYPRHPQYLHHDALPTRPRSAVVHDSRRYHHHPQYLDGRSSPASHAYSLPPRLASSQPYAPSSKPVSRASPPTSEIYEDEKAEIFAQQLRDSEEDSIHPSSSPSRPETPGRYTVADDASSDGSTVDETPTARQTMRSLLHLATTALPLSIAFCLYTIFALTFSTFLSPFRICMTSSPTFKTRLYHLLLSPLNFHRCCICLPPFTLPASRASSSSRTPLSSTQSSPQPSSYNRPMSPFITTLLFAPFIALPLAICAWVMGTAWGLGAMVSDEEAGDDRDERRFAEKVVSWWASWLSQGFEEQDVEVPQAGRGRRKREMAQHGGRDGMFV